MIILAIDPGTTESGFIVLEGEAIKGKGKIKNEELQTGKYKIWFDVADVIAIEMPACYGMAVGKSVFETVLWAGKFAATAEQRGKPWFRVYRKAENKIDKIGGVCMTICRTNKAKDSNIRQALIDLYEPTGGGAVPQVGTKNQPGPLYGVAKDIWAALAVAVTFRESMAAEIIRSKQ